MSVRTRRKLYALVAVITIALAAVLVAISFPEIKDTTYKIHSAPQIAGTSFTGSYIKLNQESKTFQIKIVENEQTQHSAIGTYTASKTQLTITIVDKRSAVIENTILKIDGDKITYTLGGLQYVFKK